MTAVKEALNRKLAARMFELICGQIVSESIHAAATLGIANILVDGPKSADELARETKTDARALYRMMRVLASCDVFTEDRDRRFSLTPLAEFLRSDVDLSLRATAMLFGGEAHGRLWGNLLNSLRTGQASFGKVFGVSFADGIRSDLRLAGIFTSGMSGMARRNVKELLSVYDFSPLKRIVEIDGGNGRLLIAILRANPEIRGVLYNPPAECPAASRTIEAAGLEERCEVVGGDKFVSVPDQADAYVMWNAFRHLGDDEAIGLLGIIRDSMTRHGRVLMLEALVPEGNEPAASKLMDLISLVSTGGLLRTEAEFKEIHAAAGLRLKRMVPVPSITGLALLEGERA